MRGAWFLLLVSIPDCCAPVCVLYVLQFSSQQSNGLRTPSPHYLLQTGFYKRSLFREREREKKTSRQKWQDKAIKIDCACSVHRMVQLSLPKKKKKNGSINISFLYLQSFVWPLAWFATFSWTFFFSSHRDVNSSSFFILRKCISMTCNGNSSSWYKNDFFFCLFSLFPF